MLSAVKLNVVTIRMGRGSEQGEEQNVAKILAGQDTLMAHTKVRLDSNGVDINGAGVPRSEKAVPGEIVWIVSCGGNETGSFRGDTTEGQVMGPWELADQGLQHLWKSEGHSVVLKWLGWGDGTATASVTVKHSDATPCTLTFPKVD